MFGGLDLTRFEPPSLRKKIIEFYKGESALFNVNYGMVHHEL
jgi:hypothetical protein